MKLNLGCGKNYLSGYLNVDKRAECNPDRVYDLEITPWVWDTDSVNEIVMRHSLEHMGADTEVFLSIMKEIYRVCKHEAQIHIDVPHPLSNNYIGDPTHVRPITQGVLTLFSKAKCAEWDKLGWPNTRLAVYLDVDFEIIHVNHKLQSYWANALNTGQLTQQDMEYAFQTYNNVVDETTYILKVIK